MPPTNRLEPSQRYGLGIGVFSGRRAISCAACSTPVRRSPARAEVLSPTISMDTTTIRGILMVVPPSRQSLPPHLDAELQPSRCDEPGRHAKRRGRAELRTERFVRRAVGQIQGVHEQVELE